MKGDCDGCLKGIRQKEFETHLGLNKKCWYCLGVYLAGPTAGRNRAVSLRSERAMSRAYPSVELDTVVEERSDPELEATAVEVRSQEWLQYISY